MEIQRRQLIEILESRGDHDQARKAEAELPDPVDTDQHEDDLRRFHISHDELPSLPGEPPSKDGDS